MYAIKTGLQVASLLLLFGCGGGSLDVYRTVRFNAVPGSQTLFLLQGSTLDARRYLAISTDTGQTWQSRMLWIPARDGLVLDRERWLLLTSSRLYLTTDGGKSFKPRLTPGGIARLRFRLFNLGENRVGALFDRRVFLSSNGGSDWDEVSVSFSLAGGPYGLHEYPDCLSVCRGRLLIGTDQARLLAADESGRWEERSLLPSLETRHIEEGVSIVESLWCGPNTSIALLSGSRSGLVWLRDPSRFIPLDRLPMELYPLGDELFVRVGRKIYELTDSRLAEVGELSLKPTEGLDLIVLVSRKRFLYVPPMSFRPVETVKSGQIH